MNTEEARFGAVEACELEQLTSPSRYSGLSDAPQPTSSYNSVAAPHPAAGENNRTVSSTGGHGGVPSRNYYIGTIIDSL